MRCRLLDGLGLRAAVALFVIACVSGTGVAYAQDLGPHLVPVEAPTAPQEQDNGDDPEANLPYLFAVFIITWAGLFGYLFYISRRHRDTRRELEELKAALDEKERRAAADEGA